MFAMPRPADRQTELRQLRGRLLIGLSGGADSMALALTALSCRENGVTVIGAVHVNHGMRGEASDGDEAFVADFCRRHDIPLQVFRLTPPAHAGEAWAREARYDAFARAYAEFRADALLLAHHRQDQAETLLLHLLRGTGLKGLTGMKYRSEQRGMVILRPLLDTDRDTLRQMLLDAGQDWRQDATNDTDIYLRNRVRHQLLPLMEQLAPGLGDRLCVTAELLRRDDEALEMYAAAAAQDMGEDWIRLSVFGQHPAAVRARILRRWLGGYFRNGLTARQTDDALALIDAAAGCACNLSDGLVLRRSDRFLHLTGIPAKMPEPVPVNGTGQFIMGDTTLCIAPGDDDRCDGRLCQDLPAELPQGWVLRTRQQGDYICPFGMEGSQSLQDYLVNRRVPAPFRDRIPLLANGSEILWVCGVGAGALPHRKNHEQCLRISVQIPPVWMK